MGTSRLNKQNRTDRILVLVALLIFLMSSGALYFDNWMWGSRGARGSGIGFLASKTGDIRVKYDGDLKFQKASRGLEIAYNDSVYVGENSQAKLVLGQSEMVVTENSLVVLRKENSSSFLNLDYGSVFGKVGAGEKIIIDTGDGKPIELNSKKGVQLSVSKVGTRTEVRVTKGEAEMEVDGKKTTIDSSSRIVMAQEKKPVLEKLTIEAIAPKRSDILYSETETRVPFQWKWSNSRAPASQEKYVLEFSTSPQFESIYAQKVVTGDLTSSMAVSESLSLFYRVRGPAGELSQVEKVNFVRVRTPVIIKPVAKSRIFSLDGQVTSVEFQFQRPTRMDIQYQVSKTEDFAEPILNEVTQDLEFERPLEVGRYFVRARGDYGSGKQTKWSDRVSFAVIRKLNQPMLTSLPKRSRYVIPNQEYASELYSANSDRVQDHLYKSGHLKGYFPLADAQVDQINLKFQNADGTVDRITRTQEQWPKSKLYPIRHRYQYQLALKDGDIGPWSEPHIIEITMEPPRPLGEPTYSGVNRNGQARAQWAMTPILFARSYDVEVSENPDFASARDLNVKEPKVSMLLSDGEYYWRARARDEKGRIISDFSMPYKIQNRTSLNLANKEKAERKLASKETSTTRVERQKEAPFEKSGFWAWAGVGYNFVDYSQSIPGRGTVSSGYPKGPSEYLEMGFTGKNHWGGVVTAKYTPGTIEFDIDGGSGGRFKDNYVWTTFSAEALYATTTEYMLWNSPITIGYRAGFQQHRPPFVFLDYNANPNLKDPQFTTASAGLQAEWEKSRWTYYWNMRYQYPLTTQAQAGNNFTITERTFSFDGLVGTAYNLTRQFKVGLFWYGQWHQYKFTYSDQAQTNSGSQSLFYSNIDFRLGVEF